MNRKTIVFLFASCIMLIANAQDRGQVKVEGYTIQDNKKGKKVPVADINMVVYKGTEQIDELKTNKKGHYEVMLDFGFQYKVVLENNPGYISMSFAVDAKVPPAKGDIKPSVGLDIPLFETGTNEIDTLKFKFPFTKFKFDGNKKFIDDPKYLSDFEKGLFKEYKDAQKQVKKQQADKAAQAKLDANAHFMLIGGKLMAGNLPKTPIKNMHIHLLNEKGAAVETVSTDKYGKFSFSKLALDRNYSVKMDDSDSAKLAGTKITMYNRSGKEIYSTTSGAKGGFEFKLLASDRVNLVQLEVEDNSLLIAGTLEALLNGKSQPVAKSRVVLADAVTGSIYEIVETDANGKFVFSKLPPDKNFIVRLEESSSELANIKIIMKDKDGNEIATSNADGFGKFRFQLLASDKESMNKLQIDETEIKMDLVGKFLTADEKNAPLDNVKIDLMDDAGAVLQSTTSNDKGVFVFNNLVLYSGYYFRLDPTNPKVSSITAVVLAEKNDKALKEYKVDASGVKSRILASDQKRLGKLYLK
jgi:hypothetical protein